MHPHHRLALLLIGSLSLLGCASPWEKNYQRNPLLDRTFPPTQRVEIRVVPFERLANYENAEHKRRVDSATAPEDLTPQQRLEAKNRLLEALQLKERGDEIEILGWSRFADANPPDLRGKELHEFARKIGADVVVASSGYAGQVTRMTEYPLSSYNDYYTTAIGPRGRRGTAFTGTSYSTVWVPAMVTENQYYCQAIFLRRTPHGSTT